MRALATAAGLAGAIAIAGLAAWLLMDAATANSQSATASRSVRANGAASNAVSPSTSAPTTAATSSATTPGATTRSATTPTAAAASPSSAPTPRPASQPASQPLPAVQGQQAFIDPVTRQLRAPEHEEIAALQAAALAGARRVARTFAAEVQEVPLPNGGVAATVPEELHTFSVATRTPDGRIVFEHATGPAQAKALVRARAATANTTSQGQGTEARDDR